MKQPSKATWGVAVVVAGVVVITAMTVKAGAFGGSPQQPGSPTGDSIPESSGPVPEPSGPVPEPSGSVPDYPDSAPAYDVSDCEYSEEPELGGVAAISPSGEYLAGSQLRGPDGEKTDFDPEVERLGMDGTEVTAVNSRGEVVGTSYAKTKPGEPTVSWVFYDGEAVELGPPAELDAPKDAFVEVTATSINEDGDIAGHVVVASTVNNRREVTQTPLKWEPGSREPKVLKAGADGASGDAVTDDGSVIGSSIGPEPGTDPAADNKDPKVYKWSPDGERETLPIPAGTVDVAGDWLLSDTGDASYRWKMTGDDEPEKLEMPATPPNDIDAAGRVFDGDEKNALVMSDSEPEELPVPDGQAAKTHFRADTVGTHAAVIAGDKGVGDEADEESGQAEHTSVLWRCGG